MNRRGFIGAILAAAAAPAVVKASSLMKWVPTESGLLTPGWVSVEDYRHEFPMEIGRYEGVTIRLSDPRAVKVYGAALAAEVLRKNRALELLESAGLIERRP